MPHARGHPLVTADLRANTVPCAFMESDLALDVTVTKGADAILLLTAALRAELGAEVG